MSGLGCLFDMAVEILAELMKMDAWNVSLELMQRHGIAGCSEVVTTETEG